MPDYYIVKANITEFIKLEAVGSITVHEYWRYCFPRLYFPCLVCRYICLQFSKRADFGAGDRNISVVLHKYGMGSSYYFSPEWYRFKDFIKALAGTTCEFCNLQQAHDLHHVLYLRFGCEHPADVMLLCHICHALQHHRIHGQKVKYKRGSPLDERLSGGELLEYLIEKRDREWMAYRKRLEMLYEVTGDGADLIAQGEMYLARCESALPSF